MFVTIGFNEIIVIWICVWSLRSTCAHTSPSEKWYSVGNTITDDEPSLKRLSVLYCFCIPRENALFITFRMFVDIFDSLLNNKCFENELV